MNVDPAHLPSNTGAMTKLTLRDQAWLVFLLFLAAFIWQWDRSWLSEAEDVMPILAAFPLLWWCGRPWRWRAGGIFLDRQWLAAAAAVWTGGIALNLTVLLALAWTMALWSLLAVRLEPTAVKSAARLLPLAWLAFPWVALEAAPIGWWFRLSAADVTAGIFNILGFDVAQNGTRLLIQGMPVSVDPECAGLNTLQAMLIAGLVATHRQLDSTRNYLWMIPALFAMAWCANTLRVVFVVFVGLGFGAEFAAGRFHGWGGTLILALTFVICLLAFSWAQQGWKRFSQGQAGSRLPWSETAVLLFCALMSSNLIANWQAWPSDRPGIVAFGFWILPPAAALVMHLRSRGRGSWRIPSPWLSASALALVLLGAATSLNVLKHGALALAFAAFMPQRLLMILWLLLAVSWTPALGVAAYNAGPTAITLLRLSLGAAALIIGVLCLRPAPVREKQPLPDSRSSLRRPALAAALVAAVIITMLWELNPLQDNAPRFAFLPRRGLGFAGTDIPLTPEEQKTYHGLQALKRLYIVGADSVVIFAIDGSGNRHAIHDPDYCFGGGGWRIAASRPQPLPGGYAMQVALTRGSDHAETLYWFTDGETRHASELHYWWQTALRRLTFGHSGPEPLLVVMQIGGAAIGNVDWDQVLARMPDLLLL